METLDEEPPSKIPDPFGPSGDSPSMLEKIATVMADYPFLAVEGMKERKSMADIRMKENKSFLERLFGIDMKRYLDL